MRDVETDQNDMPIVGRIGLQDRASAYYPVCEELVDLVNSEEFEDTVRTSAVRAEDLAGADFIPRLRNKGATFCKASLLPHLNGRPPIIFGLKAVKTQVRGGSIDGE